MATRATDGGKTEAQLVPVLLGETKSLALDMPPETPLEKGAKMTKKARRQGVSGQLSWSAIVQNPWSSLLNDAPLVCLDNADHRWFAKQMIDAIRQLGVSVSLARRKSTYACVSLPSSHSIRHSFPDSTKTKLASEKTDMVAFPFLVHQVDDEFAATHDSNDTVCTDKRLACPLTSQIELAKTQCRDFIEEQFSVQAVPPENKRPPIVLWMESIDRLKLVQFVLQSNTDQTTGYKKLPSLVLQLLAHLQPEDTRRLCPSLRDFEVDFAHAVGGVCFGLPGFAGSPKSTQEIKHTGGAGSSQKDALITSPVAEPIFLRQKYPLVPSNPALVATLYCYWSEWLRVHSVAIEHFDGFLNSIISSSLRFLDRTTNTDTFTHMAENMGSFISLQCMTTPAWISDPDKQAALHAVRRKNHKAMQSLESEVHKLLYVFLGHGVPEQRLVSAMHRACHMDAATTELSEAEALVATGVEGSQWRNRSFRKISIAKAYDLLIKHAHIAALDELHEMIQRVARNDPLQAILIDDTTACDVLRSIEGIFHDDRFHLVVQFTGANKRERHRHYDGVHQTLFIGLASDVSLYQRVAAMRYHDPRTGALEIRRDEGVHTQRLSYTPILMQMLESSDVSHRLTGVSLLREWMGYPPIQANNWNEVNKMAAIGALRMIDCVATNSRVGDDLDLLLQTMRLALAFDSRVGAFEKDKIDRDPELLITWCPGVVSATEREPIAYDTMTEMLVNFVTETERKEPYTFMEQLIDQLRTMVVEVNPRVWTSDIKPIPEGYKDTAYTRAGLGYQLSTAHRIDKPVAPTACTILQERCAKLERCLRRQEMIYFGYPAEEIDGLLKTVVQAGDDVCQFTRVKHVCPANYEFGLAMHTSASGVSMASPTSRFYVLQPDPTRPVDVWPRYLAIERRFAKTVESRMYARYNAAADHNNKPAPEPAVLQVKQPKRSSPCNQDQQEMYDPAHPAPKRPRVERARV